MAVLNLGQVSHSHYWARGSFLLTLNAHIFLTFFLFSFLFLIYSGPAFNILIIKTNGTGDRSSSLICSTTDEGHSLPESSTFLSFHHYMSSDANQQSWVFFGFSDKCEMCLKVLGGNNYIFYVISKLKMAVILAIFLHFCEILNILDKNETYYFLM